MQKALGTFFFLALSADSTNRIVQIFMAIGGHIDGSSCAYKFSNIVPCQIQILGRRTWTVVSATISRNNFFDLRAGREIIVAGYVNELRPNGHGRTPRNTKVVSIGAMTACATRFRWFLVLIVAGTNRWYENQFKRVCRFLQRGPILPRASVSCSIAGHSRIESIEIRCFNK